MKRIVIENENGSVSHVELNDTDRVYLEEPECQEEPLGNPDINAAIKGESSVFDEIRNAVAQALLEHSAAFAHIYFELQSVTPDGFFVYNHTPADTGYTTTFKARWYLFNGVVSLDFTGQTVLQTNSGREEPPLMMNSY